MCDCSRNNINSTLGDGGGDGSDTFIGLLDTPSTYAGSANKFVRVNAGATALVFDNAGAGVVDFIDLADVPNNYGSGYKQRLITNGTNAIQYENDTFINNTDCPSSYTSKGGDFVKVKVDESGLEFESVDVPQIFPDLLDVPPYAGANKYVVTNGTNDGITYLTPPTIPTVPTDVFTGDFADVPADHGTANQILLTNGTTASWGQTAFTRLSDVSAGFSGQANKLVAVNSGATALTYVTNATPTTFVSLTDCPSSYSGQGGKFVKVKVDETGLNFVTGGTADIGLLELDDNTGVTTYTDDTIGTVPQANTGNTGFQLSTLLSAQTMIPRLVQNFIGMFYPSGKPTFSYTTADAVYPLNTHLFAVYRPNYSDSGTPYLNFFWTSIQPAGGSRMYGPDHTALDIAPITNEGVTTNHHSCGAELYPFNNKTVPSPVSSVYQDWVMDIEISFNSRIKITNIDSKAFLIYINTPDFLDDLNTRPGYDKIDKARACDFSFTPDFTTDNYVNININKVLTIPCWDVALDRPPRFDVYMKAVNSNFDNSTFTINTYYYINCSYKILGCRPSSKEYVVEIPIP